MRRTRSVVVLVGAMAAMLWAAFPAGAANQQANSGAAPAKAVPTFGNVFMIIGENTTFGQVTKNTTPYLVNTFKPASAWLTTYFATTHNSTANYVALTSGQYTRCEQVDNPPAKCHQHVPNLFTSLDKAGTSWTEWMESAKKPCDLVDSGSRSKLNKYRVKHNPAVYYGNVEGAGGHFSSTDPSAECLKRVIPMGTNGQNDTSAFDAALAAGNVSRFNLIVPNECEDGHDACPPFHTGQAKLRQFDDFLAREVPKIQASPAFDSSSVIIVVYDECDCEGLNGDPDYGGGWVVSAIQSGLVQPGSYSGLLNHYSTLRMLQDGLGVSNPYLGKAATAAPIDMIWR
jgi:phosphatidylinositol-3-phosphatase